MGRSLPFDLSNRIVLSNWWVDVVRKILKDILGKLNCG